MIALSLWQPWATFVVLGVKRYETRGWYTDHLGEIAIASTKTEPAWVRRLMATEPFASILRDHDVRFSALPRGCVLARMAIIGAFPTERLVKKLDEREIALGDYSARRWGYPLVRQQVYEQPIPCKGGQKLWEWTPPEILPVATEVMDLFGRKVQ